MASNIEIIERRQDRVEDAIEKLTIISNDLNKMLAVHDQRLTQQEKDSSILFNSLEKRREELDKKLNDVYDSMSNQEEKIFQELTKFRQDMQKQHQELNEKISKIEKFNWMAIGGGIAISWVITYAAKYLFKIV